MRVLACKFNLNCVRGYKRCVCVRVLCVCVTRILVYSMCAMCDVRD